MRVLAAVKRVADPNVRIRVAPDGRGVDLANVRMAMNPFDEIAVEEAVRLKEAGVASVVIAVSIGGPGSQDTLRTALAMGADRALHVATEAELQPLAVARLLKAVVEEVSPQVVITGKQAVDDDFGQTGQMLAAMLDWPQATFASQMAVADGVVTVTREVDEGLETIELDLPCVITADLRLNAPRFASVTAILQSKRAEIEGRQAADLGVEIGPRLNTVSVTEPPLKRAGVRVASAAELIDVLRRKEAVF